jgi:DNA-binding transcriptional LysR family regulator
LLAMQSVDLNLLLALDALLAERSVTGAARRMNLSTPAMSRTLARVRDAVGDEILVRAGRRMEPTERALALRAEVGDLVERARTVLRPEGEVSLARIERTLAIRANDAVVAIAGSPIAERVRSLAAHVVLRFVPEGDEDVESLRNGRVELDIGHIDLDGPEIRIQKLREEQFVGIVRRGHPLAATRVTVAELLRYPHLSVSRRGHARGPLDAVLARTGARREIALVVPTFSAALVAVVRSELVAIVPSQLAVAATSLGVARFELPVQTPGFAVSQAWHPRFDSDAVHRWVRTCVAHVIRDSPDAVVKSQRRSKRLRGSARLHRS